MRFIHRIIISGAVIMTLAGCSGDDQPLPCAEGTVMLNGECTLDNAESYCGAGAVFKDGQCVRDNMPAVLPDMNSPTSDGGNMMAQEMGRNNTAPSCLPSCKGRVCGDDGCGGSCGTCDDATAPICNTNDGECQAICIPSCRARQCGDDGCGGSCGVCDAENGCTTQGHCVPDEWTCDKDAYDALDQCDCDCGAPDPDCDRPGLATLGCGPFEVCRQGACEEIVPDAWTCSPVQYDDGAYCDCNCGVVDPDCGLTNAISNGCALGEVCGLTSTCEPCVPECTDKVCGPDGCGGTCGPDCGLDLVCVGGVCEDGCFPTPLLCESNECGADGCGGSCGTCNLGANCMNGRCVPEPGKSCAGICKGQAPGGCSCDDGCELRGDCCPDYTSLCVCTPQCDGRVCGPDGCGGTCGDCLDPASPFCSSDGSACQATCTPRCEPGNECGADGCGGTCGTCGADETCNQKGLCVPPGWLCFDDSYGNGDVCDCACGVADPDCETLGNTYGCPLGASCTSQGLCDVSYCSSEDDCPGPAWCLGHYPTAGVARDGVCGNPVSNASAPGLPCSSDSMCASEVCAAGFCRFHCQSDTDCLMGESCVGVSLQDGVFGHALGVVSVCDGATNLGAVCQLHAECTGVGELCLATINPVTFEEVHRCGVPDGGSKLGQFCDASEPCSLGLVCANSLCAKPCPGGQSECASNETCMPSVLHGGASLSAADDVLTSACLLLQP